MYPDLHDTQRWAARNLKRNLEYKVALESIVGAHDFTHLPAADQARYTKTLELVEQDICKLREMAYVNLENTNGNSIHSTSGSNHIGSGSSRSSSPTTTQINGNQE